MLEILGLFLQAAAGHVLYLALHLESGSFPRPLTPAKEREAFAALRAGGPDAAAARDRLIRHNLPAGGPCDEEILRGHGGAGRPDLDRDDRADQGGGYLRPGAGQQVFQLCEPLHQKRTADGTAPHPARGQPGVVTGPLEGGSGQLTLADTLPDPAVMEDDCERRVEAGRLRGMIRALPEREPADHLAVWAGRRAAPDPAAGGGPAGGQPQL